MSIATVTAANRMRLVALRVLAVAYAVFLGLASFGLPSLLAAWTTTGDELPLRTAYVVWGVLGGLVVPSLALALLWRRTSVAACNGLLGLVVACATVLVIGYKAEHLFYLAGVAVPAGILLALHPQVSAAISPGRRVDRPAAAIVALMALPTVWYGVDMAVTGRATRVLDTPGGQFTMHGQYAQAAVLAFTLLLVASAGTLHQAGRGLLIAIAAVSASVVGTAGLLFPQDPMSLGAIWGAVTVTAAAAYAVLGRRKPRVRGGTITVR